MISRFEYMYHGMLWRGIVEAGEPVMTKDGPVLGEITFSGVERSLPIDRESYLYSHGGEEYRAACDGAWRVVS